MFERFSRSWQLVKASGAVLKQDTQLLVFPLISSIAALVVVVCFALPIIGLGALDGLSHWEFSASSRMTYFVGFLFYVSLYFVIFFFNAALVGAAMIRFDGGVPTVRDGLRIANSRIGSILGYALIAATVGMVLRAIQERVPFVGKIVIGLIGAGWTVATYMVVPILVTRDVGPVEAVKESAMTLKKTWGENMIGQGGIGVAFGLIHFFIILCGVALVIGAAVTGSVLLIGLAVFLVIVAVVIAALVHAALGGIYAAALYRYASSGDGVSGFDSGVLQQAFAVKK